MTRPALQLRANTLIQSDNHIEPGSLPCQLENAVQDLSPGGQCPKIPPVGFTSFWLFYKLLIQTGTHWLIPPLPLLYLDIFQFQGIGQESRCVYTSFVLSFKKANSVESCPVKKERSRLCILYYCVTRYQRFLCFSRCWGVYYHPHLWKSKKTRSLLFIVKRLLMLLYPD